MSIKTFHIRFKSDGAHLMRTEWVKGKTEEEQFEDGVKQLRKIYGNTFEVVA